MAQLGGYVSHEHAHVDADEDVTRLLGRVIYFSPTARWTTDQAELILTWDAEWTDGFTRCCGRKGMEEMKSGPVRLTWANIAE